MAENYRDELGSITSMWAVSFLPDSIPIYSLVQCTAGAQDLEYPSPPFQIEHEEGRVPDDLWLVGGFSR